MTFEPFLFISCPASTPQQHVLEDNNKLKKEKRRKNKKENNSVYLKIEISYYGISVSNINKVEHTRN